MKRLRVTFAYCVALFAFDAVADGIEVRKTWVRHFPNTYLQILPDNIGHIAAYGYELGIDSLPTDTIALVLNPRGRMIGRSEVPGGHVTTDQSGRFFFTWNEPGTHEIHCAAFAPLLERPLWKQVKTASNSIAPKSVIRIAQTVAGEAGGAWAFGSFSGDWNSGFFLTSLGTDEATHFWNVPHDNRVRSARQLVRSPDGAVHGICVSTALGKYSRPEIMSHVPGPGDQKNWPTYSSFASSYMPNAATCDREGNLIIVGTFVRDVWSTSRESIVDKRGIAGGGDWIQLGASNSAHFVVTDQERNVVVSTRRGLVKYSAEGAKLWEVSEGATANRIDERLNVDVFGNILVCRPGTNDHGFLSPELIKLNPDGVLRWRTAVHESAPRDQYFAGLVIGKEDDVYMGLFDGEHTTIVKLVERSRPGLLSEDSE